MTVVDWSIMMVDVSSYGVKYLLDRLEIQDILARYAAGQDDHQEADGEVTKAWSKVFTEDARLDYSQAGPPFGVCSYRELASIMRGAAGRAGVMSGSFHCWQHMLGLPLVEIDGDRATARTDLLATHVGRTHVRTSWHLFDAAIFHDQLIRTSAGWRIQARRLVVTFVEVIETRSLKDVASLVGAPTGGLNV
jgi:SnoaL-like domain